MTIEQAIKSWAEGVTGASFHPVRLPDDTEEADYPAGVYLSIATPSEYTHDGRDAVQRERFQLSVWADTYAAAKTHQRALLDASGSLLDVYDGCTVQAAFCDKGPELYDTEARLYHHVTELAVLYKNTEPLGS
jgi:hypothetical protein